MVLLLWDMSTSKPEIREDVFLFRDGGGKNSGTDRGPAIDSRTRGGKKSRGSDGSAGTQRPETDRECPRRDLAKCRKETFLDLPYRARAPGPPRALRGCAGPFPGWMPDAASGAGTAPVTSRPARPVRPELPGSGAGRSRRAAWAPGERGRRPRGSGPRVAGGLGRCVARPPRAGPPAQRPRAPRPPRPAPARGPPGAGPATAAGGGLDMGRRPAATGG